MKPTTLIFRIAVLAATFAICRPAQAVVPAPLQADIDKATAEIKSGDDAQVSTAIIQIRKWVDGGRPVRNVWTEWGPDLMKAGKNQEAANLLLDECVNRASESATNGASPAAIVVCIEMRANALLAARSTPSINSGQTPSINSGQAGSGQANKNDEALQAAKSYYNVCDMKLSANAVDLVGRCLARAHPEDGEIVRKWRTEQAARSTAAPAPTTSASSVMAANISVLGSSPCNG